MEDHSRRVPSPSDYDKSINWIKKTTRDLSKGSMRKTIIDQIYAEKKKLPGPSEYKAMLKNTIIGSKFSQESNINFLSETQYLGNVNPAATTYEVKESLVSKRVKGFKIIKPKTRVHWRTPKQLVGPAPGLYETQKEINMPKSPGVIIGKDKLSSMLERITRDKAKIPGVGQYNTNECYSRVCRPMKTSRF